MPVLAGALLEATVALLPWLLAWYLLGGSADNVAKNIEHFGTAIVAGPTKVAVNAWIEVAVIAGGLGLLFWVVEAKIGKSMGYDVGAPGVESIHVATPPTFGSSGGYNAGSGGFNTTASVTAEGGGSGSRGAYSTVTKSRVARSSFARSRGGRVGR